MKYFKHSLIVLFLVLSAALLAFTHPNAVNFFMLAIIVVEYLVLEWGVLPGEILRWRNRNS